jgi:formylglycine-generating enzyme required for sulfatase activity
MINIKCSINYIVYIFLITLSFSAFAQKYPKMVKVKGGTFLNYKNVSAKTTNTIVNVIILDFNVSKYPISVKEYSDYCESTGYAMPEFPINTQKSNPIVNISFNNVVDYCKWLSQKTGKKIRPIMEVEWAYIINGANLNKQKDDISALKDSNVFNNKNVEIESNGLVWEWTVDTYNKDWEKNKARVQRMVLQRLPIGKRLDNQSYIKQGMFQDSASVELGFRIAQSL